MVLLKLKCLLLVLLYSSRLSNTQRKIIAGKEVTSDKGYVVYLTKAPISKQEYDAWICGGSIVSDKHIVTSAACVEDIEYMYAIAGYKYYVPYDKIDEDKCTKVMKKKVVRSCIPKMYELDYAKIEKWSYIDIAIVIVESPFNFNDANYKTLCSYAPSKIAINFDPRYQDSSTDSMVLGWGHTEKWRKPEDKTDYNQHILNYAGTLIQDKQECKKYFENIPDLSRVIDRYMICTLEAGNIDESGETINKPRLVDGCTPITKLMSAGEIRCEEDEVLIDETRKSFFTRIMERQQRNNYRREGICQNDHGGPLVTWMGAHEVLIGVASVFRVNNESHCTGPFLYTSTQCNGIFLSCIIESENLQNKRQGSRRAQCNKSPAELGYELVQRDISWKNHPDGPAENELPIKN